MSGGSQPPKSKFIEHEKEGYIRLYQIRDYGEKPSPIYIPISHAQKQTKKGDILLARYGASLGKVFVAEYGAYNVAMTKVVIKHEGSVTNKYCYYYYLSSLYQEKLKLISRTAQAGFNSTDFDDLYFPLPPFEEQNRIVTRIEELYTQLDKIKLALN